MATLTTLVNFNNRLSGISGVTIDNGDIFGTTYGESGGYGSGYGSVYELVNVGSNGYDLTTLVNFNITDGAYPYAGHLITDASGDLFGTTSEGGAYGDGTVFEVTKVGNGYASTPTTLASFNGTDGNNPVIGLTADVAGNLFGTTRLGGANNDGTVFEIAKVGNGYASTPTTLVSFDGSDGSNPYGGLILDANGDIFGTTTGTVFEIAKTSTGYGTAPNTIANLSGTIEEGSVWCLVADAAGDLFGTTDSGVFEIAKTSSGYAAPTMLSGPEGNNLIIDAAGDLFGTSEGGGSSNLGTVFEIAKTSTGYATPTILVSFNGTNGSFPYAGLTADTAGDLFGTTQSGGANDDGTVFEITDSGFMTSTAITQAQIKLITADVLKFYADEVNHKSTTADLSKLTTDVTGLNLTQATLGQVLNSALQTDAGANAAMLANDLAGIYYPKIASDLSKNGVGLPGDLTAMVAETALVGVTYHGLANHESATVALNQTVALFKL